MFIQWVQCQKPEPFGRESPPARICVRQEHARPIGLSVQSAAYPDRSRAGYKHAVAGRQFQLGRGMGADGQRLQHGDLLRGRWPVCFQPVLSRCGKVLLKPSVLMDPVQVEPRAGVCPAALTCSACPAGDTGH